MIKIFIAVGGLMCISAAQAVAGQADIFGKKYGISARPFLLAYRPSLGMSPLENYPSVSQQALVGSGSQASIAGSLSHAAAVADFPGDDALLVFADKKKVVLAPARPRDGSKAVRVGLVGKNLLTYSKKTFTKDAAERLASAMKGRDSVAAVKALGQVFDNRLSQGQVIVDVRSAGWYKLADWPYVPKNPEIPRLNKAAGAIGLNELEKNIGKENVARLRRGWRLHQWRRTTPHNWWISPPRREYPQETISPHPWLFEKVSDSKESIIIYFGSDSGKPDETIYRLWPELLK